MDSPCVGSAEPQTEGVCELLIDLDFGSDSKKEEMTTDVVLEQAIADSKGVDFQGGVSSQIQSRNDQKPRSSKTQSLKIGSDYSTNPETATQRNIFDSHCRLDKVLSKKEQCDPEGFQDFIATYFGDFSKNFEGCITAFSKPSMWGRVSLQCMSESNKSHFPFRITRGSTSLAILVFGLLSAAFLHLQKNSRVRIWKPSFAKFLLLRCRKSWDWEKSAFKKVPLCP
jgi:hypothetical protein